MDELVDNMRIFFDLDSYENINHKEIHKFNFDYENKLEKFYQYAKDLNNSMSFTSMMINTNYLIETDNMLQIIDDYKDNCIKLLDKNLDKIINSIKILHDMNKKIILNFYEKAQNKLLIMKSYLNFTLTEITRTKKLSDEVKRGINAISNLKNLENYSNIIESYENSVNKIKEIVSQFSDKSAFDKVSNIYNNNYDIIDNYQIIMQNKSLNLQSFIDFFFENSYLFLSNNNIIWNI